MCTPGMGLPGQSSLAAAAGEGEGTVGCSRNKQAGLHAWGTESGGTGQRTLVGKFFMLCPVLIYLHRTMFQGALKAVQNPAGAGWAREG